MSTEPAEDKELNPRLVEESAELDLARRQAEEVSRSKIDFLDRMSHELRTPLNSVLGFTNVLLKNRKLTSSPLEFDYLQRIRLNGMHLLDLVNDLLDLNRIERGEMTVKLKDLDLGSLIEETVDQLEDWGLKDNVKAHSVVPPHLDPIRADESRVRQVLRNLVGNAIKVHGRGIDHPSCGCRGAHGPEDSRRGHRRRGPARQNQDDLHSLRTGRRGQDTCPTRLGPGIGHFQRTL